jgi:light-regulated signal transduction histidine kinase (bacteriophytochrome)
MSAARLSENPPEEAEAAQPDAIQPCGWLIVCNAQASKVLRHSANLGLLFPDRGDSFIGSSVSELLGSETAHGLRNALARFISPTRPALFLDRQLAGSDGAFDIATSRSGDETLIEIEQASPRGDRDALDRMRAMIDRIAPTTEVEKLLTTAARLIFSVLQYDRVSILRFEEDGSTRVVAQHKSLDLEQDDAAADLTNIPRARLDAARIRFIVDHDAPPTPILGEADRTPLDPTLLDPAGLDLTWSYLRAPDDDERQALRRGGFAASLSVTLMVDGAVWGLVLCQDRAPRHPSMSVRAVTEIFGDFVSLQLQALLQKRALQELAAGGGSPAE